MCARVLCFFAFPTKKGRVVSRVLLLCPRLPPSKAPPVLSLSHRSLVCEACEGGWVLPYHPVPPPPRCLYTYAALSGRQDRPSLSFIQPFLPPPILTCICCARQFRCPRCFSFFPSLFPPVLLPSPVKGPSLYADPLLSLSLPPGAHNHHHPFPKKSK